MSACDQSSFGSAFVSKKNKQSQKVDVPEIDHNVKDADGRITCSRTFKVGQHARIVRNLKPGEEIDESKITNLDDLKHGEINGFWTCVDGAEAQALGAEIQREGYKLRLPLRILLPMDKPHREEDDE